LLPAPLPTACFREFPKFTLLKISQEKKPVLLELQVLLD